MLTERVGIVFVQLAREICISSDGRERCWWSIPYVLTAVSVHIDYLFETDSVI